MPSVNLLLPLAPLCAPLCSGCYEFTGTNIGFSPSILRKDLKKRMLKKCSHNGGRLCGWEASTELNPFGGPWLQCLATNAAVPCVPNGLLQASA